MPLAARIAISSTFILLSGGCIYGWLVQSEFPRSPVGQWAFGLGYVGCLAGAGVFGLWGRKPGWGFPVELRERSGGG